MTLKKSHIYSNSCLDISHFLGKRVQLFTAFFQAWSIAEDGGVRLHNLLHAQAQIGGHCGTVVVEKLVDVGNGSLTG